MKTSLTQWTRTLLVCGAAALAATAGAQSVSTTTTTTQGTISDFGPGHVIIRSTTSEPARYTFNERTVYVDETGAPVSASVLSSGIPATVEYTRVGDALIADKVIVRTRTPAAVQTTTATTTSGVISDFGSGRMVIRTESSAEPVPYTFTESTTYVDEAGNPVSVETVKSGLPVTVYYSQDNGRMVASRVVVRQASAPAPVVEERRTTTRTITTDEIRDADDDDD